jgi:PhzF family phenazine biosynthesis protein
MRTTITQIDAFTSEPFAGNPAGVCLIEKAADEHWMQNVAAEMNLSETAFLYRVERGYNLRWFTPAAEVKLCGHATLASAHFLFQEGRVPRESAISFFTKSGELKARLDNGWIELDFPASKITAAPPPEGLLDALGAVAHYVGKSSFDYLVEVESEQTVRLLAPDFASIARLPVRGVIVTAKSTGEYDFVSRFFAPAVGVNEDPVTGSAHCALGPYWQTKLGKSSFLAYQASKRGGVMKVRVTGDRVYLSGQAVTVMKCELMV